MRRYEKKAILEMLDTIEDAQKHMSYEVLAACQESAVSIGNAIEKSEGEGTESVALLEKYCEDLYIISQNTGSPNLRKDVQLIRKKIKSEIPVKLEVVFFPYKASMWDSMESIYLAFKERDDVNTWLVPIPYYNRNNDGTVDQMHCESDLFPEDEEVTDWKAFDVARIKPDIAFIHNPYDDLNFVTTVDPAYYSFELKKNVDCLVYCPYFSTNGGLAKGQSLCKAYLYVDYILAQSEMQVGYYDKSISREKFLIMGSPKFDKVININREREENPDKFYKGFPEDWKKRCEGKRVYFYNTSINGLLADTPVFIEKMEYVFRTFENQKDAVLFWRPHPLFDSTFKALRPQYYDRYLKAKEEFLSEGVGILDETPDISASVAFCDAFIGDIGTSIISLFGVTGKPIFILNNNITYEPTDSDIVDSVFMGVPTDIRRDGYMVTEGNQLYRCDMPLHSPIVFHYVARISEWADYLYGPCYKYKDNLYICPNCMEDIKVIHKDGTISSIDLKHHTDQPNKFSYDVMYRNYIFLIPNEYPYIVRINLENDEVSYTDDIRENFIIENANMVRRCGGIFFRNEEMIITSPKDNRVVVIDINTLKYKVVYIGENIGIGYKMAFFHVDSDNKEYLWMLPLRSLTIRRYSMTSGKTEDFKLKIRGFKCSDPDDDSENDDILPFSSYVIDNDYLYIAPARGNKFIALDMKSGKYNEIEHDLSIKWRGRNKFYVNGSRGYVFKYDNRFYWQSDTQHRIYEILLSPDRIKTVREIQVKFYENEIIDHAYGFSEQAPWNGYGLEESAVNPLSKFITGRVNGKQFNKQRQLDAYRNVSNNLNGQCGQKVYDFLMRGRK